MKKSFVEYNSKKNATPYNAGTVCFCLTQYTKDYIFENRKLTADIDSDIRDAVLVDVINYLGVTGGWLDFALCTKHLYDGRKHEQYVDPRCLLTIIVNWYADYMFNGDVVNSVLLNNHMNNCTKEFDPNDGAIVLLDFINYVAEVNNYDRVFTIKELFDRAKKQKHKRDLHELKSFLNLSNQYEQRLNNGESINSIYAEMAASHSFIGIREDGAYLYNKRIRDEIGIEEMCLFERNKVEKKLYAICYAYEKSGASKKEPTKNKTIIKTLEEMKQR